MAYVPVPKDLTRVKSKFLFNLTKRQVVCFGLGALVGLPVFFLTKGAIGVSMAAALMIVIMLPFFLFAMFERNGQPLEGLRSLGRDVPVDQAKPGDIVFFDGTMGEGVAGITHCGIYVGNNMMIHCGSPLGYANLNDSYWRQHFHSFGRVPN